MSLRVRTPAVVTLSALIAANSRLVTPSSSTGALTTAFDLIESESVVVGDDSARNTLGSRLLGVAGAISEWVGPGTMRTPGSVMVPIRRRFMMSEAYFQTTQRCPGQIQLIVRSSGKITIHIFEGGTTRGSPSGVVSVNMSAIESALPHPLDNDAVPEHVGIARAFSQSCRKRGAGANWIMVGGSVPRQ